MFIAVTRLKEKAEKDAELCRSYGHECFTVSPLAARVHQDRVDAFARQVNGGDFDCIFFTSALPAKVLGPLLNRTPRVIAIGPQTARILAEEGIESETLPSFYSRDFAPYLGEWLSGKHVGIPRADVPNPVMIEGIESYGGIVYESRIYGLEPTEEVLFVENADAILFTSANSFRYARWEQRPGLLLMAIGEITAGAMREGGAPPAVVGNGSLEGTLQALNHYLQPEHEVSCLMSDVASPVPEAGYIVVDKPRGPSSHQIAAWIRDILGVNTGHGGTLDPMVSGVLVVMLGRAVRMAPLLLGQEKEYICLMRVHGDVSAGALRTVADEFTGRIYQRPPKVSAVKRALRIRRIEELEILEHQGRLVLFRVRCEAGTYIRSLCHHMGLALGVGAHMQELRRIRSGLFHESGACTLHDIQDAMVAAKEGDPIPLSRLIHPVERVAGSLPRVVVRDSAVDAVCHGARLAAVGVLSTTDFAKGDTVALFTQADRMVSLGTALVSSTSFAPGDTGLVIAPHTVLMRPGTYPRIWKKHHET